MEGNQIMVDKDKSIITQVAAKIAADLVISGKSVSEFTATFLDLKDVLLEVIYSGEPAMLVTEEQQVAAVMQTFPQATQVQAFNGSLQVAGKQHGDLPDWLIDACKRDGITKVYDNRDGLSANPKRPWFKAVDDKEKAYWPPRGN